jgi:hypothetical protein
MHVHRAESRILGWRNTLLDARITAVLEHEKGYYMIAQYEESALDREWETRITQHMLSLKIY